MKQIILISFLCVSFMCGWAQEKNSEQFKKRLFDAKISEFTMILKLTPQQVEDFKPIYTEYSKDMLKVWGDHKKMVKPTTQEEAVAAVKKQLKRQEQIQQIRSKYIDEYAKILTPHQICYLYGVEDQIQKKLWNRKVQPHGKQHGKLPNRPSGTSPVAPVHQASH